ncbi:MAG: adenylate/guanylate cyclase domain-containing protein [Leptospirales bacterium]
MNLVNKLLISSEDKNDDSEIKLQKKILVLSSLLIATFGAFWGLIYFIYGEVRSAYIPWTYSILSLTSIAVYFTFHKYKLFRFLQLLLPLLLPLFLMISLGDFHYSSAVILWSFTCPLGAFLFLSRKKAILWFVAYIAVVVIGFIFEGTMKPSGTLTPLLIKLFYVMNIVGVSTVVFILLSYFLAQKNTITKLLEIEREKSEELLLNILPKQIADILKSGSRTIADEYQNVSILFADIVNFTPLSQKCKPKELVQMLNEVFSYFDELVEKYDVEKIKTIGDCYMVASGIPQSRNDHAFALVSLALDIQKHFRGNKYNRTKISFRIGINSGPVVAGVIGKKKFIYDLWGDAVNTASRMESNGEKDMIQITKSTYELIKNDFVCKSKGFIDVKGKGQLAVWHVLKPVQVKSQVILQ